MYIYIYIYIYIYTRIHRFHAAINITPRTLFDFAPVHVEQFHLPPSLEHSSMSCCHQRNPVPDATAFSCIFAW